MPEAPPCLFPVRNQITDRESISIPIPADLPAETEDVCALLGAAWALVLYRFAAAEEIAFVLCQEEKRVVTASIRPEEAVKRLLEDCRQSVPYGSHQVNSGLFFSDSFHHDIAITLLVDLSHRSVSLHSNQLDEAEARFVASASAEAIHAITAKPDQELRAVSLCHEQHLAQLDTWNQRQPIYSPPATSIYELVQPFSRSQPSAPAICAWDGDITYGQLDALTGQLAAHLQEMNVRPNRVVALCFEKSLWAIISMLAVVRTGAAFVFLDPSYPPAHRQLILSQASPVIILTSPSHRQLFDDDTPVIPVTRTLLSQLPPSTDVFQPPNTMQDPAFLVFTSGSSGTPKGCVLDHGSLAGSIALGRNWAFDTTCNRIFQFSPFVFGTCNLEFFSAFLTGGVLCIASDHEWKNDLIGVINRMQPTGLILPPSVAKVISPHMIPSVKMLAMGGEPLDASLLDRWVDHVRLVQGYGMSENSGILTLNLNLTGDSDPRGVGQSPNGRLWLVNPDDHQQLAAIGAVGELVYEGPGVASKYLNHPDKSAATFIEPPVWMQYFASLPGRGRFLKTGDLARYNPDGTISHLGRKDSQVKIRGQRVDLKEIEQAVRPQLGAAFDVFVELVRPKRSTPILAAFLLCKNTNSRPQTEGHPFAVLPASLALKMEKLDTSLRSSLPVYMVPTVYLLLETLPTTITGKVDRRGLREQASRLTRAELDGLMHGHASEVLPPSTPMEKRLVSLMAAVLRLETTELSVTNSFLKLGGDSITAMAFVRKCATDRIVITVQDIFQAPTIASLAMRAQEKQPDRAIDQSHSERAKTTTDILQEFNLESGHLRKMGIAERGDVVDAYPSSPIQEGMLLAQAMIPSRYKTRVMWRARLNNQGEVCIERLQAAWSAVVRRHPALRTVFMPRPRDSNKHIQLVLSVDKADNAARVVDVAVDLASRPACTSSIAQMALQKLSSGEVGCRLDADHTVIDGLSLQIIMRDIVLAYDDLLPSTSPFLFREHILADAMLSREDAKAYWATRLQDCPPCQFPTLNKESDIPVSPNFRSIGIEIGSYSGLFDLSHKYGLTMANIFQVAWALVLQTFTGQRSVCFGYMVAGRDSSEGTWDVIGLFTNMVTRVIDLDPTKSLLDIVQATQQDFADSLPYQHISAAEVFRHLETTSSHRFNTLVSFVNVVDDGSAERSLRLETIDALDYTEYDVSLDGVMQNGSVTARIKYWDSVLTDEQAQSLVGVFQQAISVLATSARSPGELYLLSDRDRRQIKEWNGSPPETVDSCIHAYVDQQSKRHPFAPAVHAWNGSFTYQELSSYSSSLAKRLSDLGVRPGEVVPLCFEKSCWVPIAMLAVLKAGAVLVLLNPSLPFERLQSICQITEARIIITSRQNSVLCTQLEVDPIVIEDQHWVSAENWAPPVVSGEDLAYIAFTSGSTGAPKGPMIHHSAYLSSALRFGPPLHLNSEARVFQYSSYSFDVSISDHLATLLTGGCICIPSDADVKGDLGSAIENLGANWAMLTPSVSRILQPDSVPSLKTLCLIGEALTTSDVHSWSNHVTLMNTYGPTETACISHGCASTENERSKCIGQGLGTVSWIVSEDDPERLMPVGTVGELLIDGPIVGKGYLKNEEKTNAAFIDCPSWMDSMRPGHQAKLYKTGDLVQYMNDGSILFVGRKNTQVKVRGQWVELSEVENRARLCFPGESQVVVEYLADQSLLIGFVSYLMLPDTTEFQQKASLARHAMLDHLPEYMIPSAFIPVSQIPLGPTGKVDRRQLSDIIRALSPQELWKYVIGAKESAAPSTDLEGKLQQVYASVLAAPAEVIGVDDDFFHLGGSSLAAMKISARARADGFAVSVADVFQHRTIRRLAGSIQDVPTPVGVEISSRCALDSGMLESLSKRQILQTDVEDIRPCTPMQRMMLDAQQDSDVYTLCFSVQITSKSSVQAADLKDAWQAIVDRHHILRTVFIDDSYTQAILTSKAARQHDLPYQLVFNQDTPSCVTLTGHMSHAVGDAASTAIILDGLRRIYTDEELEPVVHFSEYAEYINTSSARAMQYWLVYLHGASPSIFPHTHAHRGRLCTHPITLCTDFNRISQSCQQAQTTIPNLIRSAWALTLARWTQTITFGYLVSGRDAPITSVENIVGPLLNLAVCRLELTSHSSLKDILATIQTDYTRSLAQQAGTIPALNEVEKTSGPLFNTLINHRQFPSDPSSIGDDDLHFRIISSTDPMHYDIVVVADQTPTEITVSLNYWDGRIPERTVASLAASFDTILSFFIADLSSRPYDVIERVSLG
ncbi:hypothetical protein BDV39DRAFT_210790 [Aspergillus sergii]|uniref:Carrier domain-containing protein n=1 Tax=Aspergillus sergii TaxID=1034303 RepID=A0A5N6WKN6_9EURO|nr:hypothetical protein BDV39DRAFT_210790 [Aspergillus sergii]